MVRTAAATRDVVSDCAMRLQGAREQYRVLRVMGDPDHYADRKAWCAPAVSDDLSEALRALDTSEVDREDANAPA